MKLTVGSLLDLLREKRPNISLSYGYTVPNKGHSTLYFASRPISLTWKGSTARCYTEDDFLDVIPAETNYIHIFPGGFTISFFRADSLELPQVDSSVKVGNLFDGLISGVFNLSYGKYLPDNTDGAKKIEVLPLGIYPSAQFESAQEILTLRPTKANNIHFSEDGTVSFQCYTVEYYGESKDPWY